MKIHTKFHGELEINDAKIFTFEGGIPGFLDEKKYCLLPLTDTPFFILQSTSTKEVAFIMINPFEIFQQYEFELPQELLDSLKIKSEEDVLVFVILTVKEPFDQTTANLQAPIILSGNARLGKQFIMNDGKYKTKHSFFQAPIGQGEK